MYYYRLTSARARLIGTTEVLEVGQWMRGFGDRSL